MLDSSGSINLNNSLNWQNMLIFVGVNVGLRKVLKGPDAVRVGLVRFSGTAYVEFNLNQYQSAAELEIQIRRTPYNGEGKNIADGPNKVNTQVFSINYAARCDATWAAVLVSDGQVNVDVNETIGMAMKLKHRNITVVTVAVTRNIRTELLEDISADSEVLILSDRKKLISLLACMRGMKPSLLQCRTPTSLPLSPRAPDEITGMPP